MTINVNIEIINKYKGILIMQKDQNEMKHEDLIRNFRSMLSKRGVTFTWFWKEYIKPTGVRYTYFMKMLNLSSVCKDNIADIMKKYIKD